MAMSKHVMHRRGLWAAAVILGVMLGACGGSQAAPDEAVPETALPASPAAVASPTAQQPKQLGQEVVQPSATLPETDPAGAPTPIVEPPTTEAASPEPTPFTFVASDRTALVSTNPAEFNLAAGQLQFVEFMAFW